VVRSRYLQLPAVKNRTGRKTSEEWTIRDITLLAACCCSESEPLTTSNKRQEKLGWLFIRLLQIAAQRTTKSINGDYCISGAFFDDF
jgi:hypothetical protein